MSSKGVKGDRTCDEHHVIVVGRFGDNEHQITIIINTELVVIITSNISIFGVRGNS
jgi:hypothetical protein